MEVFTQQLLALKDTEHILLEDIAKMEKDMKEIRIQGEKLDAYVARKKTNALLIEGGCMESFTQQLLTQKNSEHILLENLAKMQKDMKEIQGQRERMEEFVARRKAGAAVTKGQSPMSLF